MAFFRRTSSIRFGGWWDDLMSWFGGGAYSPIDPYYHPNEPAVITDSEGVRWLTANLTNDQIRKIREGWTQGAYGEPAGTPPGGQREVDWWEWLWS